MRYAVVKIGARQFRIEEGKTVGVDRFSGSLDKVLLFVDGERTLVGRPYLDSVRVDAASEEARGKKILVRRFKAKSRYRKTKGHRQPISFIRIQKIEEVVGHGA